MPLLTIVIPTFNRSKLLEQTLNGLRAQISDAQFHEIEVVISDNDSPDDTKEMVADWSSKNHLNLKYCKNSENLGFDKNCDAGAKRSSGKFIWFMSDDDTLNNGAIETVYSALRANDDVKFAFINYSMLTPGFDEYFPYKFSKDLVVTADELMIQSKLGFSFISACVFNREAWNSLDLTNYIGTYWMQLYAARDVAIKGKSLIISKPLIQMRREGLQESRRERKTPLRKIDIFMDFHLCFLDFLETFKNSSYSNETYDAIKEFGWRDNLGQILSWKLTSDNYNLEEMKLIYKRMKKYFSNKLLFWIFHLPMLFLPKFASQFYFFFKMQFIKLKKILRPYLKRDNVNLKEA